MGWRVGAAHGRVACRAFGIDVVPRPTVCQIGSYEVAWLDADVDMVGGDGGTKALVKVKDAEGEEGTRGLALGVMDVVPYSLSCS